MSQMLPRLFARVTPLTERESAVSRQMRAYYLEDMERLEVSFVWATIFKSLAVGVESERAARSMKSAQR